ncbi:MAG: hypothetical protein M0Q87_14945 [Ottowia sp.]|nr:hypothetical protein [Ottowia sp.]
MQQTPMEPSPLQKGVDQYYQPKNPNDMDLVAIVREDLINSGLANHLSTAYDNSRFIQEAVGKDSNVQRFLLNRYWTQQLMSAKQVSIEERYCLIPNGDVQDWLRLFRSKVLPFIVQNDLPVPI